MDDAASGRTKECRRCHEILDVSCFGLKYPIRDVRVQLCRMCVREASRVHYLRDPASYKARAAANNIRIKATNRKKLREYLGESCCVDCAINDLVVLEFDHRLQEDKRADVSTLVGRAFSWSTISKEIAKCDVVCANCHRRRTARRFGWRRLIGLEDLVLPPLPKRGTPDYERIRSVRHDLARRHRNRSHILAYLQQYPCVMCGEDDPVVLDFDHTRDKLRHISDLAMRGGWSKLLTEIAKCRVLCANCHRRHTAATAGRDR